MFEVRYVDSGYMARNEGELVPEHDMTLDSRHEALEAAEDRRKEIETQDPGARAWVD